MSNVIQALKSKQYWCYENAPFDFKTKLMELMYTTNLNLQFYEKYFVNNITGKLHSWGSDALITLYDIKGVREIYNRVFNHANNN